MVSLNLEILIDVYQYFSVVFICISLRTNDVEHLFRGLLTIPICICVCVCVCALFYDVSVQISCPFFNCVVCFPTTEF